MDTRQLAAFCAVVERRSFSQAAERLGVTQPAVSLQVRALEKRLGTQLLDRSGRRVEPTEAGRRLYRGAQRLLALERQLLEDVAGEAEGPIRGQLAIGASTGPGGTVVSVLLCEFAEANPEVTVELSIFDTQRVVVIADPAVPNQTVTLSPDSDTTHAGPTVPAGATAQCRDGSYSFSEHRRGTCSHHGGVATWLIH